MSKEKELIEAKSEARIEEKKAEAKWHESISHAWSMAVIKVAGVLLIGWALIKVVFR